MCCTYQVAPGKEWTSDCAALLCRYKWGLAEGKLSHSCKIEVEHENGSTVLKQQPFETLDEVYTPVPFVSGHQSAE